MLLAFTLLTALHAAPQAPLQADSLSGTWRISGDVMGSPLDQTCTLTQSGSTLAGSCAGQTGEKLALTGEVKDGKVVFRHKNDYQGTELTIVYTATTVSAKQLKGTIEVQPMGVSGTFTAAPATAPTKP
jgi:hypothetical protein